MAGTPATYRYDKSNAEAYKDTIARLFETTRNRYPAAWAKVSPPSGVSEDDGEFNARLAWACKQAGLPVYLNGKRGNLHDRSHDILVFENPTGVKDNAGRLSGLTLIDFIIGHEEPGARFGWRDTTVVSDPNIDNGAPFMPPAAAIEPFDWDEEHGAPPVPHPPTGYPGDAFWDDVTRLLEQDMRAVGQTLNFQSGRWIARTIWDVVAGDPSGRKLSLEESVAKHRNEWRAVLGLPLL